MTNSVRQWNPDEDYAMLCEWWDGHGVPRVPRIQLPTWGLISFGVLAAWLYQDNSCGVGWLGWFVSKPGADPFTVRTALDALLGAADEVMRSQKRHSLIVMTDKRSIGKALTRHGYHAGHPATEYWRIITA